MALYPENLLNKRVLHVLPIGIACVCVIAFGFWFQRVCQERSGPAECIAWTFIIGLFLSIGLGILIWLVWLVAIYHVMLVINFLLPRSRARRAVANRAFHRLSFTKQSIAPADLPPSGRYIGTCQEKDETKQVVYEITFHMGGQIIGTVQDADRRLIIRGRFDRRGCRWGEIPSDARQLNVEDAAECANRIHWGSGFHSEVRAKVLDAQIGKMKGTYITTECGKGSIEIAYADEQDPWRIAVDPEIGDSGMDLENEAGPSTPSV